jgi:predicted phosphoribosyltransferase
MHFTTRQEAGRRLAEALEQFRGDKPVVLALARGGVVLGAKIARTLDAPLGVVLVRKLSYRSYPEYAIGAVTEDGEAIYNDDEPATRDEKWRESAEVEARHIIADRKQLYYGNGFIPPAIENKTVILVDDGIATGLSMQAAIQAARRKHPKRLIVATPVAASDSIDRLTALADEVVVLANAENFLGSVGAHYDNFPQVNDNEVKTLLQESLL